MHTVESVLLEFGALNIQILCAGTCVPDNSVRQLPNFRHLARLSGAKNWKSNRKAHQLYRSKLSTGTKLTHYLVVYDTFLPISLDSAELVLVDGALYFYVTIKN